MMMTMTMTIDDHTDEGGDVTDRHPAPVHKHDEPAHIPDEPMDANTIIAHAREHMYVGDIDETIAPSFRTIDGPFVVRNPLSKDHLSHPNDPAEPWCGNYGDYKPYALSALPTGFIDLCGTCKNKWNEKGYPRLTTPPEPEP